METEALGGIDPEQRVSTETKCLCGPVSGELGLLRLVSLKGAAGTQLVRDASKHPTMQTMAPNRDVPSVKCQQSKAKVKKPLNREGEALAE